MPLSEPQIERYSRHILLPDVGGVGQRRLLESSAAVRIAGGSAAVAALAYLAAAGVGRLIVLGDAGGAVTAADARRGILYGHSDIGRPRLHALRERIAAINPDVEVTGEGDAPVVETEPCDDVAGALIAGGEAALRFVAEVARKESR